MLHTLLKCSNISQSARNTLKSTPEGYTAYLDAPCALIIDVTRLSSNIRCLSIWAAAPNTHSMAFSINGPGSRVLPYSEWNSWLSPHWPRLTSDPAIAKKSPPCPWCKPATSGPVWASMSTYLFIIHAAFLSSPHYQIACKAARWKFNNNHLAIT